MTETDVKESGVWRRGTHDDKECCWSLRDSGLLSRRVVGPKLLRGLDSGLLRPGLWQEELAFTLHVNA